MINVPLTETLRLTSDSHNFIVEERYLSDPTKVPGYKPPEDGSIPERTEKWRQIAFYAQTPESLALCIDFAVIRTVARSDAQSLTEFVGIIRDEYQRATDAVNAAIQPPKR